VAGKKGRRRSSKQTPASSQQQEPAAKRPSGFCYWEGEVLVLNILGTPSAKSDKIGKPKGNQLKISVKALPRGGRATDYMVNFLAKEFGVKAADITVAFGRTNINKQVRITSPGKLPQVVARFLNKKRAAGETATAP